MFDLEKTNALGRVLLDAVQPEAGESAHAWERRIKAWGMANPTHPASIELKKRFFRGQGDSRDLAWLVSWALNGYPRLVLDALQAASFMATSPGDDPECTQNAPWSAYTIELPRGLLELKLGSIVTSFDVIRVVHHEADADNGFVADAKGATLSGRLAFPLPDWPEGLPPIARDSQEQLDRVRECIGRLIISVELAMTDRDVIIAPGNKKPKLGKSLNDPSVHRLAYAVTVDAREGIREYLSGERKKSPTVRWMTRGHWKWQPHGPRNSLRRWKHIEPYWNPRDSNKPLADRVHKFRKQK